MFLSSGVQRLSSVFLMSQDRFSVLLRWNETDFEPLKSKSYIVDDPRDTLLYIDEPSETMIFRMGSTESNIDQRIIKRRINSFVNTGYQYFPDVRVGQGFNIMEHEDKLDIDQIMTELRKVSAGKTVQARPIRHPSLPQVPTPSDSDSHQPTKEEAFQLGLTIWGHLQKNRTLIIKPGATTPEIEVYKEV